MNKPAKFITILFDILERESFSHLISWTKDGKSFQIHNIPEFQNSLMEEFFNTKNYQSFLRQLSMYNFKMKKSDKNEKIYSHPNFKKGKCKELSQIQRRCKQQQIDLLCNEMLNPILEMELLKQQVAQIKVEQQKLLEWIRISSQIQFWIAKILHKMVDHFTFVHLDQKHKDSYQLPLDLMFKLLFGHRPEFVTEILELLCQDIIIPASPIIECPVTPKVFPLF